MSIFSDYTVSTGLMLQCCVLIALFDDFVGGTSYDNKQIMVEAFGSGGSGAESVPF